MWVTGTNYHGWGIDMLFIARYGRKWTSCLSHSGVNYLLTGTNFDGLFPLSVFLLSVLSFVSLGPAVQRHVQNGPTSDEMEVQRAR